MPISVASKLGIQFARFVAASGNAANSAHHGFRGAFNNASSVFGSSGASGTAGSSSSTAGSSWASGLSSGGTSASSSGTTGLGGAKFHAGRGAHSTFQQSGRILANPNGSSAHDGTTTLADDDDEASLKAARIHRASQLHRSSLLSVQHRATLSSFAARQRLIESPTIPALQLILPTSLPRSQSHNAALHTSAAPAQEVQVERRSIQNDDVKPEAALPPEVAVDASPADALASTSVRQSSLETSQSHSKTAKNTKDEDPTGVADFASAVSRSTSMDLRTHSKEASEAASSTEFPADNRKVYSALVRARNTRNSIAVQVAVKELSRLPRSSLSTPLFNAALDALVETRPLYGDIQQITDLYVDMINSTCLPNVRTLSIIASVLCDRDYEISNSKKIPGAEKNNRDNDYFSQALSILNVAHTSFYGFTTIDAYNSFLRSCMVRGDAARACDVLNILSNKDQIRPNASTFIYLLQCLANDSVTKKAAARAQDKKHETDVSRMLGACQTIFDEFEVLRAAEGWQASQRDAGVWHVMIRSHFELNDAAGAIKLVEHMLSGKPRGKRHATPPQPNDETPAAVLLGFTSTKDFESAEEWLNRILDSHYNPQPQQGPTLPLPRLKRLEALFDAFAFHISALRIRTASVEELQTRLPSIRAMNRILGVRCEASMQGADRRVKLSELSGMLSINAATVAVLSANKHQETVEELLDTSLKVIDVYFRAYGEFVVSKQPNENPDILVQEIEQIISQKANGFISLLREVIEADRLEDAAALLTYLPSIFMNVNLFNLMETFPQHKDSFKVARESICRIALKLLDKRQTERLTELLVVFAEMAQLPLTELGCIPRRMSTEVLKLYLKVRKELDIQDLPLSATGWTFICDQAARAHDDDASVPWQELHDDLAKLPEDLRNEIDTTEFQRALFSKPLASPELTQKYRELLPSIDAAQSTPVPSETADSLLSTMQSPSSMSETAASSLTPIQVIDEDFGKTLIQQVASRGGRDGDVAGAMQRVRESITLTGTYPGPDAIATLMGACARTRDASAIVELKGIGDAVVNALEADPEWQRSAWLEVEDAYMRGLAHVGDAKGASEQRHKIIAAGRVPTADAYAALVNVVRNTTDDALVAEELYEESQRLGVRPTRYLMNTVISKLCRARKLDKAMQIFNSMPSVNVTPSSVTFGALINGATRIDDEATAERLFTSMEQNLDPRQASAPPFNTMIQYYVYTRKDRSKADEYYQRMLRMHVRPTDYTFKILLDMHCIGGTADIEGVERTFGELIANRDVQIQTYHWASLIEAHGKHAKNPGKAVQIFETLLHHPTSKRKKSTVTRDAVIYEALFDVLLAHDRIDMLQHYVQHMRDARVAPTAYVANVLLKGLAPHDIFQARALFAEMEDPPVGMAATGNHPVNHRHHADSTDVELSAPQPPVMPEAPSSFGFAGVLREPSTFQTMISLEMQYGEWSAASWLLGQMEQRGYPPPLISNARGLIIEMMDAQGAARAQAAAQQNQQPIAA